MSVRSWVARSVLALACLVAPPSGAVVARAQASDSGQSAVRVVHASPDAPPVDVFVDGARALTNLAFGESAGYVTLPSGWHAVAVVPAGAMSDAAVIAADLELAPDRAYTVMAVGGLASIAPLVLVDDRAPALDGEARVRFVHSSPDAPAVDVAVLGGPTLFSNVAFKDASAYLTVPAGTVDLAVRLAGTETTVLTVPAVSLTAGQVYTVAAVGLVGGTPALGALPLADS